MTEENKAPGMPTSPVSGEVAPQPAQPEPTPFAQPAQPEPAQPGQVQPEPHYAQQMPPQFYGQPQVAPQPQYLPAPLMQLTGGMKFGWFVIGALMGIGGIILSWLVNVDKAQQVKSDAIKFSIIGFVVWIVLGIAISLAIGAAITAMVAGIASSAGSYGYSGMW